MNKPRKEPASERTNDAEGTIGPQPDGELARTQAQPQVAAENPCEGVHPWITWIFPPSPHAIQGTGEFGNLTVTTRILSAFVFAFLYMAILTTGLTLVLWIYNFLSRRLNWSLKIHLKQD